MQQFKGTYIYTRRDPCAILWLTFALFVLDLNDIQWHFGVHAAWHTHPFFADSVGDSIRTSCCPGTILRA